VGAQRKGEGGGGRRGKVLRGRKRWEIRVLEEGKAREIEGNYARMLKNFAI